MTRIRVDLPGHLRTLAGVSGEVEMDVDSTRPTIADVLNALEEAYPTLQGTIRERGSGERRAFLRFYACEQDLSHESLQMPLPDAVIAGKESFRILGAIAGG